MDSIEKVIYINLPHRTDRKIQVESELLNFFSPEKIVRFNAISHTNGGIGCSMSHIGAIELAVENKWKNVLIVEDDMQWNNVNRGISLLKTLIARPYNVIVLGGTRVSYNSTTYRLLSCQSRTSYLVNQRYYQTLLSNYRKGLELLKINYITTHRGDQYWKQLQSNNWYVIVPALCIQRPDYSDIEQKRVNYTSLFNSNKKRILDSILKRR